MNAPATKPRRFDRDVDGIVLLDKPVGISSNAALQRVRGIYRALKAGHAGSLDPLASGMLPVCLGQATKVCAFLLDSRKSYRFTARLGERTDTGDSEGVIVERQSVPRLIQAQIEAALAATVGDQAQVPPMYSALKHQGRRLYDLARKGQTVERAARTIHIDELALCRFEGNEIDVFVRCSKGTYVRTLAEDLAAKLGTVAHLTALRREHVDPFGGLPMYTIDALEARREDINALDALLLMPDRALPQLASVTFDVAGREALLQGRSTAGQGEAAPGETIRMYGPDGVFLGLGEAVPEGLIQPRRLLVKCAHKCASEQ